MKQLILLFYVSSLLSCKVQRVCDSVDLDAFTHFQINQGVLKAGDTCFVFAVYDKPNGKVIFNLPSDEESGWGFAIEEIRDGFFKTTNTWSQEFVQETGGIWANIWKNDWMPEYKYVWVKKGTVGTNTRNHNKQTVYLYRKPDTNSKVVGQFNNVQTVVIWDACQNWAYVEAKDVDGKSIKGWLSPKDQCSSPITTCN